ncbi:MAG: hypothetical protein A2Z29_03985 [Chloroflexi bacterium RBG_16_56_11]|nr:MAG: hypothetical protein A2Z29_03985 [Chloroflexi bacterium RBG_16_56_11]
MDKKVRDWLLEGPAWLKYAVELQLLEGQPDVRPVLQDVAISEIIARLKSATAGIAALKSGKVHYTEAGKAYWDLFFLADIGLTVEDTGLRAEAGEIFRFQTPEGAFQIPPNVQPHYFCMSSILMASLAKMGYRDDPRLDRYIHAVIGAQMYHGGWDCYAELMGSMESCPMDDMNVLMLLGQYEKFRNSPQLEGAQDLLLQHWEDGVHLYGFGVGNRFRSLQYPAVKYGILRVLDALSLFPYAVRRKPFRNMLDFVRHKAVEGQYFAEASSRPTRALISGR